MSQVSYEWVMSHMNESCLIWMSHVSYEWVMSHMNESCHMSHVTYKWVTSHDMNESCYKKYTSSIPLVLKFLMCKTRIQKNIQWITKKKNTKILHHRAHAKEVTCKSQKFKNVYRGLKPKKNSLSSWRWHTCHAYVSWN